VRVNLRIRTGDGQVVRRRTRDPLLRRAAAAEWGTLWRLLRCRAADGGPAAVPLASGAVVLVLLFALLQSLPGGAGVVDRIGVVRAHQPLEVSLLRTPLSLFVPALDLPVWGALAQVLVVFGVAETVLGRRATLLTAYGATLAGTLYARLAVDLGPGGLLGLPASDAVVRDSGPSAAVVALAICTAWRVRAWWTGAAVVALMGAEAATAPNLAGREHLVAIAVALLTAATGELLGGPRAGLPASASTPVAAARAVAR
jgi:hypothetical protein